MIKIVTSNMRIKSMLFLLVFSLSIGFLLEKAERLFLIRQALLIKTGTFEEVIDGAVFIVLIIAAYLFLKENALIGYFLAGLGSFALLFSTYSWYRVSQKTYITVPILMLQIVLISICAMTLIALKRRFSTEEEREPNSA